MYIDTDILLAFVKKDDWLKPYVSIGKIKNPRSSVFAIIEAEIVLSREYSRKDVVRMLDEISRTNIEILDFTKQVLGKSCEFLQKYERLNVFDSVHAAFSFIHNESILSTDAVFDQIIEIKRMDPREMGR